LKIRRPGAIKNEGRYCQTIEKKVTDCRSRVGGDHSLGEPENVGEFDRENSLFDIWGKTDI